MWQEARKQEKKIRGMMVDHKKRAERRREYYEKIKQDPAQFLQAYGRPCKIHIDATIAAAADSPATMMPWQGHKDNMIDRFDGRAILDIIPEFNSSAVESQLTSLEKSSDKKEARELNYERYRILVQNDFLKIPEERFLRTIELEEQFGGKTYQATKAKEDKKKVKKEGKVGAAIGFNYDEDIDNSNPVQEIPNSSFSKVGDPMIPSNAESITEAEYGNDFEANSDDEDSDLDLDLTVDIMALNPEQRVEINSKGKTYGLGKEDFIKNLARDIEEAAELKHAKEKEEEKAMFSGRKSRRERRIIREKQLAGRKLSPPSYAVSVVEDMTAKTLSRYKNDSYSSASDSESSNSSDNSAYKKSSSTSRYKRRRTNSKKKSKSNRKLNKVEFITTFGGSGAESEEIHERENEKEKLQAARREDARMKLKNLRRDDSPAPIIGPMLPQEQLKKGRECGEKVKALDSSSSQIYKKRRGNYRDNNRRHSRSKSPISNEHKYKSQRNKSGTKDGARSRSRSGSRNRGRRSRSPRNSRYHSSSNRKSSSTRTNSKSPRRRMSNRRSRSTSRSRRSRSRSVKREGNEIKGHKSNLKPYGSDSRSKSPQKSNCRYKTEEKDCNRSIQNTTDKYQAKEKTKKESTTDSSSSEDEGTTSYRSKYRNKRRSSSSSGDENANDEKYDTKTTDGITKPSDTNIKSDGSHSIKNSTDNANLSVAKTKKMFITTNEKEGKDRSEQCTVEETFENTRKPTINKETICTQKIKSTIDNSVDLKLQRLTAPPPPSIRLRSPEPPPLKRYYKRALKRAGQSTDESMSDDEHENSKNDTGNGIAAYKGSMPYTEEPKLTNFSISSTRHAITTSSLSNVPGNNIKASSSSVVLDAKAKSAVKDKIKKRMQAAIKRQFKADQKAEEERKQRAEEERLYREEEMRDIAIKLRKREREKLNQAATSFPEDAVRPVMEESENTEWNDRLAYRPNQDGNRSDGIDCYEDVIKSRSKSRSPRVPSKRTRSKSPNDRKQSSSHSSSRDKGRELKQKRSSKYSRRSRSTSPDDSKKSNKVKLKLVDY